MISMTDMLSPSFSIADLTPTNTGIDNTPTDMEVSNLKQLAKVLELIKTRLGSFNIPSAFRSFAVNTAVGGSATSRHMKGEAADIVPVLQYAEKFWARILADKEISSKLGEISYKKHQGSIHLTLPYTNLAGFTVTGSARVADKVGGNVIYKSVGADVVSEYLSKYGLNITEQEAAIGIGLGVLMVGLGSVALIIAMKRRA